MHGNEYIRRIKRACPHIPESVIERIYRDHVDNLGYNEEEALKSLVERFGGDISKQWGE